MGDFLFITAACGVKFFSGAVAVGAGVGNSYRVRRDADAGNRDGDAFVTGAWAPDVPPEKISPPAE